MSVVGMFDMLTVICLPNRIQSPGPIDKGPFNKDSILIIKKGDIPLATQDSHDQIVDNKGI